MTDDRALRPPRQSMVFLVSCSYSAFFLNFGGGRFKRAFRELE